MVYKPLTFAITGSKKWGDEGAPLFTVRVDGVVRFQFLIAHFSILRRLLTKMRE